MLRMMLAICTVIALTAAGTVAAQTLQMRDSSGVSVPRPARGLSKAEVETRYGAPSQRIEPVGHPPISSWVYPTFIVYFEYDHVVHTVATPDGR
jgi:hypothetical protein